MNKKHKNVKKKRKEIIGCQVHLETQYEWKENKKVDTHSFHFNLFITLTHMV